MRSRTNWICATYIAIIISPHVLGQATSKPTSPVARLTADKAHVDLGDVREGGVYDFSYQLTNRSDRPIAIVQVTSPCTCTVLKPEKNLLEPGESIVLHASFDSRGRSGQQKKTIVVELNDLDQPRLELSFQATVESLYRLRPQSRISFINKRPGETLDQSLDLMAGRTETEVTILEVKLDRPGLQYEIAPVKDNGYQGQRLSLTLSETVAVGTYAATATLRAKIGEEETTISIPINGRVISQIAVLPRMLFPIESAFRGEPLPQSRVTLRAINPAQPFKIRRIDAGPNLTYTIEEEQPGQLYYVDFAINPSATPGPAAHLVTILTDSPHQSVIHIPAYLNIASRIEANPPAVYLPRSADGTNDPPNKVKVALYSSMLEFGDSPYFNTDIPYLSLNMHSASSLHERLLHITLEPNIPAGDYQGVIKVWANAPSASADTTPPDLLIPVYVSVEESSPAMTGQVDPLIDDTNRNESQSQESIRHDAAQP